jgi:hypothetical protein
LENSGRQSCFGSCREEFTPIEILTLAEQITTYGRDAVYFERQKSLLISALQLSIEIGKNDIFGELKRVKTVSSSAVISNRVFVVHGHDEVVKMELEIFIKILIDTNRFTTPDRSRINTYRKV